MRLIHQPGLYFLLISQYRHQILQLNFLDYLRSYLFLILKFYFYFFFPRYILQLFFLQYFFFRWLVTQIGWHTIFQDILLTNTTIQWYKTFNNYITYENINNFVPFYPYVVNLDKLQHTSTPHHFRYYYRKMSDSAIIARNALVKLLNEASKLLKVSSHFGPFFVFLLAQCTISFLRHLPSPSALVSWL